MNIMIVTSLRNIFVNMRNLSFINRTFLSLSHRKTFKSKYITRYTQQSTSRNFHAYSVCCKNFTEKEIRFNGVLVSVHEQYQNAEEFEQDLKGLLHDWERKGRRSAFLEVPIALSHLISIAAKYGFSYHHARHHHAVLCLWLIENMENKIPSFANHQVGVAGACFNENANELLVVQDKGRFSKWWKFPGGFSDIGEFIGETAVREVAEETGVQSEFKSVLSLRQQHNVFFNQSDLYFICRLQPLSYEINPCPDEIEQCKWIHLNELLEMKHSTPFVKLVCSLILQGKETGFRNIDVIAEEVESWVTKNKKMIIYHRPMQ